MARRLRLRHGHQGEQEDHIGADRGGKRGVVHPLQGIAGPGHGQDQQRQGPWARLEHRRHQSRAPCPQQGAGHSLQTAGIGLIQLRLQHHHRGHRSPVAVRQVRQMAGQHGSHGGAGEPQRIALVRIPAAGEEAQGFQQFRDLQVGRPAPGRGQVAPAGHQDHPLQGATHQDQAPAAQRVLQAGRKGAGHRQRDVPLQPQPPGTDPGRRQQAAGRRPEAADQEKQRQPLSRQGAHGGRGRHPQHRHQHRHRPAAREALQRAETNGHGAAGRHQPIRRASAQQPGDQNQRQRRQAEPGDADLPGLPIQVEDRAWRLEVRQAALAEKSRHGPPAGASRQKTCRDASLQAAVCAVAGKAQKRPYRSGTPAAGPARRHYPGTPR